MADLDPRTNTDDRLELMGETLPVIVGNETTQTTSTAHGLEPEIEKNSAPLYGATGICLPG